MATTEEFEALKYGKHSHATVFGFDFGIYTVRPPGYVGRHRIWGSITTFVRTEPIGKPMDLGSGIAATRTITFQRTTGSGKRV